MAEPAPSPTSDQTDFPAEVARLEKIIRALMDRAERSTSAQGSDFSRFETQVVLEGQVRARTAELEAALRENEKVNRALRESEEKFHGLVSQSMVGIVLVEDGRFTYSNPKFNEIFGYSATEVGDLRPLDTAIESDRPMVEEQTRRRMAGEEDHVQYGFRGLRKDGQVVDIDCHGSTMRHGNKTVLISLIMDITERVRIEAEVRVLQEALREQATRDQLTGLYNRHYLEASLGRELIQAERAGNPVSMIMGDLDHFKAVNDRYGHLAGDEVLRCFGELVMRHVRASDIFCRYGGEEFVLVLPELEVDAAIERAEQMREELALAPVVFGDSQISMTVSFGVATFPSDGTTGDELIAAADRALYQAKAAGRNRVEVSPGSVAAD